MAHRIDVAKHFGAETFLAGSDEARAVLAATKKRGVDVAFEVAGEQSAIDAVFASVKPGGCVVLAGIPDDNRTK